MELKGYIFYIFKIRIGKFKMYEGNILHFYNSFFKSTMINIFHIFFLIRFFFLLVADSLLCKNDFIFYKKLNHIDFMVCTPSKYKSIFVCCKEKFFSVH